MCIIFYKYLNWEWDFAFPWSRLFPWRWNRDGEFFVQWSQICDQHCFHFWLIPIWTIVRRANWLGRAIFLSGDWAGGRFCCRRWPTRCPFRPAVPTPWPTWARRRRFWDWRRRRRGWRPGRLGSRAERARGTSPGPPCPRSSTCTCCSCIAPTSAWRPPPTWSRSRDGTRCWWITAPRKTSPLRSPPAKPPSVHVPSRIATSSFYIIIQFLFRLYYILSYSDLSNYIHLIIYIYLFLIFNTYTNTHSCYSFIYIFDLKIIIIFIFIIIIWTYSFYIIFN